MIISIVLAVGGVCLKRPTDWSTGYPDAASVAPAARRFYLLYSRDGAKSSPFLGSPLATFTQFKRSMFALLRSAVTTKYDAKLELPRRNAAHPKATALQAAAIDVSFAMLGQRSESSRAVGGEETSGAASWSWPCSGHEVGARQRVTSSLCPPSWGSKTALLGLFYFGV
ncbi:MAG: hypothetical protein OXO50_14685 [Caldilineaceae bacterium]|nr:hypothetical protein [Caldilineaceae bacterium]